MGKQNKIESEVLKTLELLDEQVHLESNPYFFTRLQAEIESLESERSSSKGVFSIGVLQPSVIILLLIINILTFIFTFEGVSQSSSERDEYLQKIASEYSLNEVKYDLPFTNGQE